MTTTLIVGDPHIARSAWPSRADLAGDSYFACEQLISLAREYQVSQVILMGDVLDSDRPEADDIAVILSFLEALYRLDASVYYIQGQHERSRRRGVTEPRPWLALSPRATHAHGKLLTLADGKIACGLDYQPPDLLAPYLANLPEVHTLLAHQAWEELLPSGARCQGKLADLPVARVITGDLHKHLCLQVQGLDGRQVEVYSPGSLCQQSISEDPHKAVFLLDESGVISSLPIRSRPYLTFLLQCRQDLEEALTLSRSWTAPEDLPEYLRSPVIRLRYTPVVLGALSEFEMVWQGRGHLFPTLLPGGSVSQLLPERSLAGSTDLLSKAISRRCEGEDRLWALALADSPTPKDELRRLLNTSLAGQE